jgi:hypothetical protein
MENSKKHLFYLHGFASSPLSDKAQYLKKQLAERGLHLLIPDLNVPDFGHLTMTAILDTLAQAIQALPEGDIYLIGSSMGGRAALHFYDLHKETFAQRVKKIMLLAPATAPFREEHFALLSASVYKNWKVQGNLLFYHYQNQEPVPLHYGFVEDMLKYDTPNVQVDIPMMIIQGSRDEVIPVTESESFAATRPNVELRVVDSDHRLNDQSETIFRTVVEFFEL